MAFSSVIFIFCICLFLLLGLFLVTNVKAHKFGMHWLGIFFLCLALNFADGMLFLDGFYLAYPKLAFWEDPLVFLYGPLLLFFAKRMRQEALALRDVWHILPFILIFLLILFTYHFKPDEYKIEILNRVNTLELPPEMLAVLIFIFIHFFLYAFRARRLLRTYRDNLRGYYSHLEVTWAIQVINYLLLIFVFSLASTLLEAAGSIDLYKSALVLSASLTTLLVFRILLKALNEPLFKLPAPSRKSNDSIEEEEVVIAKINKELANKIYKDPTLTLGQLSEKINVPNRIVSQVINKHMANNFYDLINSARVQEAAQLLTDAPQLNITEVMFETGFNSKSSFNTQFKKAFGQSPRTYRRNFSK